MKELQQAFNLRVSLHPNLSSYVCFLRACKDVKASFSLKKRAFPKLVEKGDYSRADFSEILKHLENMA